MRALATPLVVVAALCFAAGCPPPLDDVDGGSDIHLSDAGAILLPPPDAGFDDAGAPAVDAGVNTGAVVVTSVSPSSGPLSSLDPDGSPKRVTIDGSGFNVGVDEDQVSRNHVFVDGVEANGVIAFGTDSTHISFFVPPCASPGPKTVRVENPLGIGELENGYTCFSPVRIDSVTPAAGNVDGGDVVTLAGEGFTAPMIVTVGGRQVVDLVVAPDGDSATFIAPPGAGPGRVDVVATDTFARFVAPLAFTYVSPLELVSVTPPVVDDVGAVVELRGRGFVDDASVTIGGAGAARDNLISDARLRVVTPSGLSGAQDVVVDRADASVTLAGGLVVRPPLTGALALSAVVPARVDVAGAAEVTLAGEQLTGASAVRFGGVDAASFTVVDDRTITAVVPAGAAAGAVDVDVTTGAGTVTLAGGLTYVDAVVVDDVDPAEGPAAGGTPVFVTGRGFVAPCTVRFGGVAAADASVVSPTSLVATTPAGAPGNVDVVVTCGAAAGAFDALQRGALAGGFRFDAPLTVRGVLPSRGAAGGGTFVTVTGTGFEKGTPTVFFGDAQALPLDVTVVSDSALTLRTPLSTVVAAVDVKVRVGAEEAVASRAFTYFNPSSGLPGARGGPIDGALTIVAVDAVTGRGVPSLTAYVGTSDHPAVSALTNFAGEATLSAPDLVGAQTVTVAGDCYSSATFVDVDASLLTVALIPLCGTPSPPPPGESPPPATIQGRVFGFAKEFFDPAVLDQSGCGQQLVAPGPFPKCEIALAIVNTTSADELSRIPNAGGANIAFEEGDNFFIANSRVGQLALVAIAGIFDTNNGTLRFRQMGVRERVFPERGVDLVDQDIELTIDLDTTVDVSLPDAPVRAVDDDIHLGFLPTITRVIPFLQFGGEGAFVYTQAVAGAVNQPLAPMPDVPGELLTFVSGAYTTDGRNLVASAGTVDLVAGETYVHGTGTIEWGDVDQNGNSVIEGEVFVAEADGQRFASVVQSTDGVSTIQLSSPVPFSASNVAYHIGHPGPPSSEVIEDGVGDVVHGGVSIQPVLGLPEPLSPVENGALVDRTMRWKAAPGQQPTIHDMFLFDPFSSVASNPPQDDCAAACAWEFLVGGSRTKVIVPRVPDRDAIRASLSTVERLCLDDPSLPGCATFFPDPGYASGQKLWVPPSDLPRGGMVWQHEAIFTPGLDAADWSFLDIGLRGRRAWTTDVHVFVHGD